MIKLLLLLAITTAHAHMHDRPDLNDWFGGLHNSKSGLCCSGSEGTVLAIDEVRTTDIDQCKIGRSVDGPVPPSHYCVRLEGNWWQVPDGSIVIVPNQYGEALVWPVWYGDSNNNHKDVYIRCFLPGALT